MIGYEVMFSLWRLYDYGGLFFAVPWLYRKVSCESANTIDCHWQLVTAHLRLLESRPEALTIVPVVIVTTALSHVPPNSRDNYLPPAAPAAPRLSRFYRCCFPALASHNHSTSKQSIYRQYTRRPIPSHPIPSTPQYYVMAPLPRLSSPDPSSKLPIP